MLDEGFTSKLVVGDDGIVEVLFHRPALALQVLSGRALRVVALRHVLQRHARGGVLLVAGHADPLTLFELAGDLADVAGCPVDLLDLRAASTVMQYQIITTGQRWWARDAQAALFESAILSEKTALDTARAALLADIQERGSVYGR